MKSANSTLAAGPDGHPNPHPNGPRNYTSSADATYPDLRDTLVATLLGSVAEQAPDADLPAVMSDLDRHVDACLRDLLDNTYPRSRSASAEPIDPEGSDGLIPLATLEITEAAARRIARSNVALPIRWFGEMMDKRSTFWGDESIMEFLAQLLVGIADVNEAEAVQGFNRLIDHLVEIMADADDGVLVPEFLVSAVFAVALTPAATAVASRLIRVASDDATLTLVAIKACGHWLDWLSDFCWEERRSDRLARVARGRTIQALAGFPAEPLSSPAVPGSIERFCELVEAERQIAQGAINQWRDAKAPERERLEATLLDAASGQALRLIEPVGVDDIGRLFLARIALHQRTFMGRRGSDLFGVTTPPTRFIACNDPIRSCSDRTNRRRRFAERGN